MCGRKGGGGVAYDDGDCLFQTLGRALVFFWYFLFGLEGGGFIQLLQRHGFW